MKSSNQRRCAAKKNSVEHRLFSVPTLGFLKGSVSTKDMAVGVIGGLLGQGGVKMALDRLGLLATLPPMVQRFMPLLSGVVTGVAMNYASKSNLPVVNKVLKRGAGKSYMTGAVAAGAVVQLWQELQAQFPDTFNDYVYLPSMNGMLIDRQMNGMLIDTPGNSAANLSALHALNMANADEDSI